MIKNINYYTHPGYCWRRNSKKKGGAEKLINCSVYIPLLALLLLLILRSVIIFSEAFMNSCEYLSSSEKLRNKYNVVLKSITVFSAPRL